MNKIKFDEFIRNTSKKTGVSQRQLHESWDALIDGLIEECTNGEVKIYLKKLGNFMNTYRPEREGIDPRDGSRIIVKGRYTPKLKFHKSFIDTVNENVGDFEL